MMLDLAKFANCNCKGGEDIHPFSLCTMANLYEQQKDYIVSLVQDGEGN
jgi:hypothetical protein